MQKKNRTIGSAPFSRHGLMMTLGALESSMRKTSKEQRKKSLKWTEWKYFQNIQRNRLRLTAYTRENGGGTRVDKETLRAFMES